MGFTVNTKMLSAWAINRLLELKEKYDLINQNCNRALGGMAAMTRL